MTAAATQAPTCIEPGCGRPSHALDRCTAHYGQFVRAHPDRPRRVRVSPDATLAERIAAHSHPETIDGVDHVVWSGFRYRGIPGIAVAVDDGHGRRRKRRVYNVRAEVLAAAGRPRPNHGNRWFAVVRCGVPNCVDPDHLAWVNRRADTALTPEVVDDLIARHNRGDLNVSDAADTLGVARQTIYRAMRKRGYDPKG